MKLSEIKVLEAQETHHGATVMLKGGWYLRRKLANANQNLSFSIHRLMEDGQLGECCIRGYDNAENQVVEFVWMPYAGEGVDRIWFQAWCKDEARDAFYKWLENLLCAGDEPIPEAMESENGLTIVLEGGYYLEFSSRVDSNTNRYLIYRLMDEDVLGECSYTTNKWQDKSTFNIDISITGDRYSQIYRAASLKHLKQAFIEWVERSLKSVVIDESLSVNSLFTRD
jgi:hypothetical protein